MSFIDTAQAFIADHHLKVMAGFFSTWVLPAMLHVGLRRANMLEKGSVWDVRLRRIMKLTLDV